MHAVFARAIEPIQDATRFVFVTSPQALKPDFAPSFYGASTFRITEPEHGLAFLRALRPDNLAQVRKLSLFVEAFYTRGPDRGPAHVPDTDTGRMPLPFWVPEPNAPAWYALLDALREQLVGLRELEVFVNAELTGYHQDVPRMGAGEDPDFVRRLARLQGLERLTLDGFFSREWPAYLEKELGLGRDGVDGRGKAVWTAEGKTESYLVVLERYQGYCPPCEL